ncbi:MAG: RING-HC finger protein [Deltaproteobacteria bacterium]|nr:RING-HC finger protein [Deltaproteobacteria bacterium]
MPGKPTLDPENRTYVSCPRCSVQIPADLPVCPFCRQPVAAPPPAAPKDIRELLVVPDRFPAAKKYLREHGKWVKIAAPAVAAVAVLWVVFLLVTRLTVTIPADATFPIEVAREKNGGVVLLKGKLTNRGEDVPDLSLRSIGITAEFRMGDGRVERKRVFPKSPFRGEGALFRGESGDFELEVPKEAKEVILRAEVVNLGEDRQFVPAGQRSSRPPAKSRR